MDAGILSVFEIPSLMQLYLASCMEVKAPLNKVALFECQCLAPFALLSALESRPGRLIGMFATRLLVAGRMVDCIALPFSPSCVSNPKSNR